MALTSKKVDVLLTDDDVQNHLMVVPAHAEWITTAATLTGATGASTYAAETGKSHVVKWVAVSNDVMTAGNSNVGGTLLTMGSIRQYCHGTAFLPVNFRLATNTAVVATIVAQSGVLASVQMGGYTIRE